MTHTAFAHGLIHPTPGPGADRVQLGHGPGGQLSAALLQRALSAALRQRGAQRAGRRRGRRNRGGRLVVSTDSFVVSPLEFPGGNIGSLAVHATVNNIAMMGGRPLFLSAGFVLEEGLPLDQLDRIVAAMAEAARSADIELIAGDTKVVERGKADGIFITTTGIGTRPTSFTPGPARAKPGDAVVISGPIGRHGVAILSAREALGSEIEVQSDSTLLFALVDRLRGALEGEVHVLRDPTRGGLAGSLNEIAAASGVGIVLDEHALPVPGPVTAACDRLGLDPLYVANAGIFVALVPSALADDAVDALRLHPLGRSARLIGTVVDDHAGLVLMRTAAGGTRVVDLLPGDQQPRIC